MIDLLLRVAVDHEQDGFFTPDFLALVNKVRRQN